MVRITLLTALILASCSAKDEQFCECISASDELNLFSNEVLMEGLSEEAPATIKSLRTKKDSLCKPYELKGGEEMLKLKEECGLED